MILKSTKKKDEYKTKNRGLKTISITMKLIFMNFK